jgi:large subunit ribosomal protein L9
VTAAAVVIATATATGTASPMPEAILLKDVESLGEKGAVEAAKRDQQAEERARQDAVTRAGEFAELLNRTVLTLSHQAGEDGRLFGSVTNQDIADAIREARDISIDKRKVHLDEPIKHVGTYMVVVEMADGVTATIKTIVSEA